MGVKGLMCAVGISLAALATMLALPCSPHDAETLKMAFVVDRPITTYPEYLELMMDGEVYIERDGMSSHIVKSEMGWHWLQRLSILVHAE